ncbi:MAG: CinA family protein [Chloroflexota bacterium]|nr:CinA family protein [Chloroflexota bacterium]MDE2841390.1 CinA family protein [Chloroflexota bacterium]MDE2932112.1 CinA family protein [Chloroflexota bacterium]
MEQRAIAPSLDHEVRQLVEQIGILLARQGHTLAVGETSAGGALASLIPAVPRSESWFLGGMVLYAGSDIPLAQSIRSVARAHGVVSEEYSAALAELVKRTFACDWALAESGIAGPQTGRRSAKPVGMVCLAVVGSSGRRAPAKERGASPRATEELGGTERSVDELDGNGTIMATLDSGRESLWTVTHEFADAGRTANQHQFAVESLRLFLHVLEAYEREQQCLRV